MPLDKAARIAAERQKKADESKPRPLNPPFPFGAKPFKPRFFGLTLTRRSTSAGAALR